MSSKFEARLAPYVGREDMSIEELVDGAGELLEVVAPEQTRHKVSERPDVRTIRYYTSQGLLPKPVSYEGGRARYDDEHLLRLLLIKKLQADYKTLRQIRRDLEGVTREDVLGRIADRSRDDVAPPDDSNQASSESIEGSAEDVTALAMRRFELAEGSVDVAADVLDDPDRRARLVSQLRSLADDLDS